ncbi:MAG: hypothetical protein ACOCQG_02000 [Candidatus Nanoarchaeia archaeon]
MDSKPTIIEEKPVPMFELKSEISKIKKRDGDLNYRGQKTAEYLDVFVNLGSKKGKELVNEIQALEIPRLKEEHIYKIVDVMPTDVEGIKLVLHGYTLSVSKDNMKKIADVIQKYAQ